MLHCRWLNPLYSLLLAFSTDFSANWGFWLYLDVLLVIDMATSWNMGRNINASLHFSVVLFYYVSIVKLYWLYCCDLQIVWCTRQGWKEVKNDRMLNASLIWLLSSKKSPPKTCCCRKNSLWSKMSVYRLMHLSKLKLYTWSGRGGPW